MIQDASFIEELVNQVISINPEKVEQYKKKPTMIGWFVGECMKASKGKANPKDISDLLKERLS